MEVSLARSITKDIKPIITWCEEEYKQLDELPFTDENDNPDTGTLTLSGAIDISNMFRDSLKPCFKLLAEKVNELEAEFDYYPTVDEANEGLNILKGRIETLEGKKDNYAQKNELTKINTDIENLTTYTNGELEAIKARIEVLESENNTLKNRVAALEEKKDPDSEWKAYYTEFTENVTDKYNSYFMYGYWPADKLFGWNNVDFTKDEETVPDGEYLLIFHDKNQQLHFFRLISMDYSAPEFAKGHLDEIYSKEYHSSEGRFDISNVELDIDECDEIRFDAIYMKK